MFVLKDQHKQYFIYVLFSTLNLVAIVTLVQPLIYKTIPKPIPKPIIIQIEIKQHYPKAGIYNERSIKLNRQLKRYITINKQYLNGASRLLYDTLLIQIVL